MELDGLIRFVIIGALAVGMGLAWLLLLAGDSALQQACHINCRSVTGLTWWIIWFQFFVYGASVVLQMGKFLIAKGPIILLLAILTILEMIQADRLLDLKDDGYGHGSRINATVAGHSAVAGFNLLLILFLGLVTLDSDNGNAEDGSTKNEHKHVPEPPMTPGGHHMKPMTSRAASMRSMSPPASEASYPAIPGR